MSIDTTIEVYIELMKSVFFDALLTDAERSYKLTLMIMSVVEKYSDGNGNAFMRADTPTGACNV